MADQDDGSDAQPESQSGKKITRRQFLKKSATGVAAGAAGLAYLSNPPFVHAQSGVDSISWLGWEHYNVEKITASFEEKTGIEVNAGFFDANSQAYSKLRAGGTRDFDLVMADGYWPELYYNEGLIQAVEYDQLTYLDRMHANFIPPSYQNRKGEQGTQTLFQMEDGSMAAAPNCWGGYGFTYNTDRIPKEEAKKVSALYNPDFGGHIVPSGRSQINIALTGIMIGAEDPWSLSDSQLARCKQELIKQKELILTRWKSVDDLERMFRAGVAWIGPEWSGVYRRLFMDGKPFDHILAPEPAGLGWIDSWMITSGVESQEKYDACMEWINHRNKPENMAYIASEIGWSPCVDVQGLISDRLYRALFQDNTEAVDQLIQFQTPDRPEKWAQVWDEVQAA